MRVEDVSPTAANFAGALGRDDQSVSGKGLCIALSPDGRRAYVGGHSGVWRSDDGGSTWSHPEWQPATVGAATRPGALPASNVYDLHVNPTNSDIVFAAVGRDGRAPSVAGVYRSADGAQTWTQVHQFTETTGGVTRVGMVGCIAAVPDDPSTLYAAGEFAVARTADGGATWTESAPDPNGSVFHVAAGPSRPGGRRVFAIGTRVWYSLDGGVSWHADPVAIGLGAATDGAGASARALAIDPADDNVVYLERGDLTLWKGEYPAPPSTAVGNWIQLPSPPIAGGTDSGGTFVIPGTGPGGAPSLYVSDRRSVHGAVADPATTSDWTLVEDGNCHVDPHGLALSADFHQAGPNASPPTPGRAVLVNDGGVNVTIDGMRTWSNATGLSTLNVVNVAVNSVPGGPTAITFGTGDNNGFSTADGGAHWKTQAYLGGDNDCSFSDPRQPTRTVLFAPRANPTGGGKGEVFLFVSSDANPPDTAINSSDLRQIPAPPAAVDENGHPTWGWNAVSYWYDYGYRPIVLTVAGEAPQAGGDFVTIRFAGVVGVNSGQLMRSTALSTIAADADWMTAATADGPGVKAFQVGPVLPDPLISVVQASGGHASPTFYVGNAPPTVTGATGSMGLWKLAPGAAAWQRIVPGRSGPTIASRFFVDPYRPELVYVLGADHMYRSEDGGASWSVDASLEGMITDGGAFPLIVTGTDDSTQSVLRDMQFDPQRPGFRLAAGIAGVFMTTDGTTWQPLLRSTAVSMQPTGITYDWVACDRAVYIGTSNRGLLRISPLPPDWDFPHGSLQATTGQISLLRINDVGTGYGPPEDFLDAEVIVLLDSEPEKAFGLQLRSDANRPMADGMLGLLRDCFNRNRPVRLEFLRTGCRTAQIVRVIENT